MRRLGHVSLGNAMVALLTTLTLAAPAAAHTSDQYSETLLTLTGYTIVDQARGGRHLPRCQVMPAEAALDPGLLSEIKTAQWAAPKYLDVMQSESGGLIPE